MSLKIRSKDHARQLVLPNGQSMTVTPEGIEVHPDLEGEVSKAIGLMEHIEEWPPPAKKNPVPAAAESSPEAKEGKEK